MSSAVDMAPVAGDSDWMPSRPGRSNRGRGRGARRAQPSSEPREAAAGEQAATQPISGPLFFGDLDVSMPPAINGSEMQVGMIGTVPQVTRTEQAQQAAPQAAASSPPGTTPAGDAPQQSQPVSQTRMTPLCGWQISATTSAKSRAWCKNCSEKFDSGELRVGPDWKNGTPPWFHIHCVDTLFPADSGINHYSDLSTEKQLEAKKTLALHRAQRGVTRDRQPPSKRARVTSLVAPPTSTLPTGSVGHHHAKGHPANPIHPPPTSRRSSSSEFSSSTSRRAIGSTTPAYGK